MLFNQIKMYELESLYSPYFIGEETKAQRVKELPKAIDQVSSRVENQGQAIWLQSLHT